MVLKLPALIIILAVSLVSVKPCNATELSDINTGLKALPLLTNKIHGDITMAIIYDPSNSVSQNDAGNIKRAIDTGTIKTEDGKLSALLVSVHELGKLSRAKLAFLTLGLESYFDDINTATSAASILTFSTDIDCVRAAKCIIGVVTRPEISIYYSKPAADAAKIEFSQNFSMLVKQP